MRCWIFEATSFLNRLILNYAKASDSQQRGLIIILYGGFLLNNNKYRRQLKTQKPTEIEYKRGVSVPNVII